MKVKAKLYPFCYWFRIERGKEKRGGLFTPLLSRRLTDTSGSISFVPLHVKGAEEVEQTEEQTNRQYAQHSPGCVLGSVAVLVALRISRDVWTCYVCGYRREDEYAYDKADCSAHCTHDDR